MTTPIQLSVGRQRRTAIVSPSEAYYIPHIKSQMNSIIKNLTTVINHIEGVTPKAIVYGLEPAFKESQRLVPVDTGKLKRSGFIETKRTANGTVAAMGYGRYGRPTYAGFVHERLDVRHAPPTQAKFLEVAVMQHVDTFRRRVGLYIQRQTGIKKGG